MTYIKYFMSANVLLIKSQILYCYLEANDKVNIDIARDISIEEVLVFDWFRKNKEEDEKEEESAKEKKCKEREEKLHLTLKEKAKEIYTSYKDLFWKNERDTNEILGKINTYFDENFWLYIYVYLLMKLGMRANAYSIQKADDGWSDVICNLWKQFSDDNKYNGDVLFLIKDCCQQTTRMYDDSLLSYNYYPDKYFEQFASDKGMEAYFFRFVHSDNYIPINHRNSNEVYKFDAYTDLSFFKHLLQEELVNDKEK